MKLIYIHNREIDSGKANVIQAISMCDTFASKGVTVEMVLPYVKKKMENPDEFVRKRFNVKSRIKFSFYSKIKVFDRLNILGSYPGIKNFLKSSEADIYYTRSPLIFYIVASHNLPVVYEAHNSTTHNSIKFLDSFWTAKVIKASRMSNCKLFIPISGKLGKYWEKRGVPPEKILPLHSGFNDRMFVKNIDKESARVRLGLPLDKNIVTYTGSLYPDREIENIIKLARHFPGVSFVVVGGPNENVGHYRSLTEKKGLKNINFVGPVRYSDVPLYLFASDVLLALWSRKVPTINFCSPLKLFEYMASGRIIVAHGFPTIREVIRTEENGLLVIPGDLQDLVEKTTWALNNTSGIRDVAKVARKEAFRKYSWDRRVSAILEAISFNEIPGSAVSDIPGNERIMTGLGSGSTTI